MSDLQPDTTIGPCRILRPIGAGGMGAVYLAEHTKLGKQVALKVLSAHLAADPEYVGRFEREARSLAALEHPNLVGILDFGEDQGYRYIVMPYVAGGSARDRVATVGPLAVGVVLGIARDVLKGLAYAHGQGFVHRDIKPSNILLDEQGNARIVDFGLAKSLDAGNSLTLTGESMGTPHYMAPEQWDNAPADPRMDLWAVGVSLHHLLTGQVPFAGSGASQIVKAVNLTPHPSLVSCGVSGASPALQAFLDRLLAKEPQDRFASADAALAALDELATGKQSAPPEASGDALDRTVKARPEVVGGAPPPARPGGGPRARGSRPPSRAGARVLVVFLLLAGLGGVGAGGWWWWQQQVAADAAAWSQAQQTVEQAGSDHSRAIAALEGYLSARPALAPAGTREAAHDALAQAQARLALRTAWEQAQHQAHAHGPDGALRILEAFRDANPQVAFRPEVDAAIAHRQRKRLQLASERGRFPGSEREHAKKHLSPGSIIEPADPRAAKSGGLPSLENGTFDYTAELDVPNSLPLGASVPCKIWLHNADAIDAVSSVAFVGRSDFDVSREERWRDWRERRVVKGKGSIGLMVAIKANVLGRLTIPSLAVRFDGDQVANTRPVDVTVHDCDARLKHGMKAWAEASFECSAAEAGGSALLSWRVYFRDASSSVDPRSIMPVPDGVIGVVGSLRIIDDGYTKGEDGHPWRITRLTRLIVFDGPGVVKSFGKVDFGSRRFSSFSCEGTVEVEPDEIRVSEKASADREAGGDYPLADSRSIPSGIRHSVLAEGRRFVVTAGGVIKALRPGGGSQEIWRYPREGSLAKGVPIGLVAARDCLIILEERCHQSFFVTAVSMDQGLLMWQLDLRGSNGELNADKVRWLIAGGGFDRDFREAMMWWNRPVHEGKDPRVHPHAVQMTAAFSRAVALCYDNPESAAITDGPTGYIIRPLVDHLFFSKVIPQDKDGLVFTFHEVKPGETVSRIAKRHGMSSEFLNLMRQHDAHSTRLSLGERLKVVIPFRYEAPYEIHVDKSDAFLDLYVCGLLVRRYQVVEPARLLSLPSVRDLEGIEQRAWHPAFSRSGQVIPFGQEGNPLGPVWLEFHCRRSDDRRVSISGPVPGRTDVGEGDIVLSERDAIELYNIMPPPGRISNSLTIVE